MNVIPLRKKFEDLRTREADFLRALDMASDELNMALHTVSRQATVIRELRNELAAMREDNAMLRLALDDANVPVPAWYLPPEAERPWGYQCLGFCRDAFAWVTVTWATNGPGNYSWYSNGYTRNDITDFAPLPPTP